MVDDEGRLFGGFAGLGAGEEPHFLRGGLVNGVFLVGFFGCEWGCVWVWVLCI